MQISTEFVIIYNAVYQETSQGKLALYHCNYCHKDISGMVRIKCAVCPDFDLCDECFSVGAEVTPHKSNHLYRVMVKCSCPSVNMFLLPAFQHIIIQMVGQLITFYVSPCSFLTLVIY